MKRLLIVEGDIPANVIVACPLKDMNQIYAGRCVECQHFGGLLQIPQGEGASWCTRHRLMCVHPVARTLLEIVDP